MAFLRSMLVDDGHSVGLHAMWGRSLRNGKSPANPQQAKTLQVHMTFQEEHLDRLLSRSGFNRLYLLPKQENGRPDNSYRVLWCQGDYKTISGHAANTTGCKGLVRGKSVDNYGLRYKQDDYAAAWTFIYPGTTPPEHLDGELMYKISGLPFGCTREVVQTWIEGLKWRAYPLRTLGPQTWLLRAATTAPVEMALFNSMPVLIRMLPPRQQHASPSIVGPRSTPAQKDPVSDLGLDPWMNFRPQKPNPSAIQSTAAGSAPRTIEGPTEQRLAAQDKKIEDMRADLEKLSVQQQAQAEEVAKKFGEAEKREKQHLMQVEHAMHTLQANVEKGFAETMQAHSKNIEAQFADLKLMFAQSRKRDAPEDEKME